MDAILERGVQELGLALGSGHPSVDFTGAFIGAAACLADRPPARAVAQVLGLILDAGACRIPLTQVGEVARTAQARLGAGVGAGDVRAVLEGLRAHGVAELRSCPVGRPRQVNGEAETLRLQLEGHAGTEFFYRLNPGRLRELAPQPTQAMGSAPARRPRPG